MTDHRATPDQWEEVKSWATPKENDSYSFCLIELRARVKALEAANTARTVEILRLTNAVANQVPDRTKLFVDTMADGDDFEPFPNDCQIRRLLVKRVSRAINLDDRKNATHYNSILRALEQLDD